MSLISISPKSECSNSFLIFLVYYLLLQRCFLNLDETNFLISSSTTLPSFWLPATWLISTPSSLANFLAFGLADEMSGILFLEKVFSWISGFITSIFFDFFSISGFSLTFSFFASEELSIVKIKSPSETLSPTFILNFNFTF